MQLLTESSRVHRTALELELWGGAGATWYTESRTQVFYKTSVLLVDEPTLQPLSGFHLYCFARLFIFAISLL